MRQTRDGGEGKRKDTIGQKGGEAADPNTNCVGVKAKIRFISSFLGRGFTSDEMTQRHKTAHQMHSARCDAGRPAPPLGEAPMC